MNMNENRYHSMPVSHTAQSSRTRNPGSASPKGRRLVASIATRTRGGPIPPAPRYPWHPETTGTPKPPGTPLPQGNTPPLNFACNSPTPLSNFESTSLKFRGFLDIAYWSDNRIACEIDGELRCAEPNASTHCPVHTLTPTTRELAQTNIKTSIFVRSADEHSRHNRRIVMACAHLRRWCARSHFALQLLGF